MICGGLPVNKGNYTETMTAGIAAFRAGKPPHIIQVFEVGTASMMAAKGAIKPVYKLMAETGASFDPGCLRCLDHNCHARHPVIDLLRAQQSGHLSAPLVAVCLTWSDRI